MPSPPPKPPPPDAFRSAVELLAVELLTEYGPDSGLIAALRADEAFEAGDRERQGHWLAVVRAIDEANRTGRRLGETSH